jgi:hypothetical protein
MRCQFALLLAALIFSAGPAGAGDFIRQLIRNKSSN